jgi:hypothetical protein
MNDGQRVVWSTAVMLIGVTLVALGGIGTALLLLIFAYGRSLTPLHTVLLAVSLVGFGAAVVLGGWTLVDLVRGRVDAANRRRWTGIWALIGATATWILAAAVG